MNTKTIFTSALSILCFTAMLAQPTLIEKVEAKADKIVIPYEKWKLPNGLTVLIHEDHSDPLINVMVTYKVGANRESIGKSGFAHFFEHMMFQGSKHVADEEHFKIVSGLGGNMNGYTTRDNTVYFENLPSNSLEMALYLESDRMGFLLDSLTQKKFENQRDAVKNEKSQNIENAPYAMAFVEVINQALYPPKHPYSWPVIGYVDDLNRATLDDVKNFFLRWYGPNNAILTVSGDVTPAEVLKLTEKYFGPIKATADVKKMRVPAVTLATDKYVAYKDNIYLPLNLRVYPTVPQYNRDEPALDLLSSMMGEGNNSIFYKNFVKSKMAIQAGVNHQTSELAGEFSFQIFAYPPEDFNLEKLFTDIDAKVKATIDEFETTGITDEALVRAKAGVESAVYNQSSSVQGKATTISEWERLLGKSSTLTDEIERYNKVTKEDILRVFTKYIKGAGAAVLNTYPIMNPKDSVKSVNPYADATFGADPEYAGLKYAPAADDMDRKARPVSGAPKPVKTPDFFSTKLKNGLGITGTKNTETPNVTLFFTIEGGSMVLSPEMLKKMGVAELTASLLNEGTKNFTTEKISAELEKIGSSISFDASKKATNITVECLKKNLDATLKVLEEKLLSPGFNAEDFKLAKKQYKEGIKSQATDPNTMSQKAFNFALYGNSVLGNDATMNTADKIELEDCKNYYNNYYSPSVTNVVVIGDLEEKDIIAKLDFLNKWQAKEVKMIPIVELPTSPEPQFYIYNKSYAPSSVIAMGYPSIKFDATGDYYKNRIANYVFGGAFNSRLNLNLREDKGYTYGIRSGFSGDKFNGVFRISSSVKAKATAASLYEIVKEFTNYQKNGITDAELTFTKNSLLNEEALKYETPSQKAAFLSNIQRNGLDKDYTVKQNQLLKSITKEEVNAQIVKSFDVNKLTTVIVGDKAKIEAQLEKAKKDATTSEVLNKVKLKKLSID